MPTMGKARWGKDRSSHCECTWCSTCGACLRETKPYYYTSASGKVAVKKMSEEARAKKITNALIAKIMAC